MLNWQYQCIHIVRLELTNFGNLGFFWKATFILLNDCHTGREDLGTVSPLYLHCMPVSWHLQALQKPYWYSGTQSWISEYPYIPYLAGALVRKVLGIGSSRVWVPSSSPTYPWGRRCRNRPWTARKEELSAIELNTLKLFPKNKNKIVQKGLDVDPGGSECLGSGTIGNMEIKSALVVDWHLRDPIA